MPHQLIRPGQIVGLITPGADHVTPLDGPLARVRLYENDLHLGWRYTARLDGLYVVFSLCRKVTNDSFHVLDRLRMRAEPTFSLVATRDALTAQDLALPHVTSLGEVFPQLVIPQPSAEDFNQEIIEQKGELHDTLAQWFSPSPGLYALVDCVYDLVSEGVTAPFTKRYQQPRGPSASPQ